MSTYLTNVFEDQSTIREGGWLKRVRQCEIIPDDYGVAWCVPHEAVAICAPMPFHTVFGWAYRVYWAWRVRCGCEGADVLSQTYALGRLHAEEAAQRTASAQRAQFERELRDKVNAAEARGAKQMLDRLVADLDLRSGRTDN